MNNIELLKDTKNNNDLLKDTKNNNDLNLNDPFWLDDYKILFYKERLTDFFPTKSMTIVEKLNAIFRMSIYLSIILYLLTNNYLYLYIMIIIGAFTCFIFYTQKDNVDIYFNSIENSTDNIIEKYTFEEKKNDMNGNKRK